MTRWEFRGYFKLKNARRIGSIDKHLSIAWDGIYSDGLAGSNCRDEKFFSDAWVRRVTHEIEISEIKEAKTSTFLDKVYDEIGITNSPDKLHNEIIDSESLNQRKDYLSRNLTFNYYQYYQSKSAKTKKRLSSLFPSEKQFYGKFWKSYHIIKTTATSEQLKVIWFYGDSNNKSELISNLLEYDSSFISHKKLKVIADLKFSIEDGGKKVLWVKLEPRNSSCDHRSSQRLVRIIDQKDDLLAVCPEVVNNFRVLIIDCQTYPESFSLSLEESEQIEILRHLYIRKNSKVYTCKQLEKVLALRRDLPNISLLK